MEKNHLKNNIYEKILNGILHFHTLFTIILSECSKTQIFL